MELRYGTNPHQGARIEEGAGPLRLVSGAPSYINVLDALNAFQLVREAGEVLSLPAATSFKHVSPAGAAVAGEVDAVMAATWGIDPDRLSAVASAYVRARDADPKSSFGDVIAVSETVDESLAEVIRRVVADGIVAPGFAAGVVEVLARKKRGTFLVFEADPSFEPPEWERRDVFGVTLAQQRDRRPISASLLETVTGAETPSHAVRDLLLGMVTLRYTQSNSVGYAKDGMLVGIGAGQQSRVDCTRLAGIKADTWWLRRHPKVAGIAFGASVPRQDRINWQIRYLEGDMDTAERRRFVDALETEPKPLTEADRREWLATLDHVALVSDGYIPFRDNIDEAAKHGVGYIAEPGGSRRNTDVIDACQEHAITLAHTGLRLFHH